MTNFIITKAADGLVNTEIRDLVNNEFKDSIIPLQLIINYISSHAAEIDKKKLELQSITLKIEPDVQITKLKFAKHLTPEMRDFLITQRVEGSSATAIRELFNTKFKGFSISYSLVQNHNKNNEKAISEKREELKKNFENKFDDEDDKRSAIKDSKHLTPEIKDFLITQKAQGSSNSKIKQLINDGFKGFLIPLYVITSYLKVHEGDVDVKKLALQPNLVDATQVTIINSAKQLTLAMRDFIITKRVEGSPIAAIRELFNTEFKNQSITLFIIESYLKNHEKDLVKKKYPAKTIIKSAEQLTPEMRDFIRVQATKNLGYAGVQKLINNEFNKSYVLLSVIQNYMKYDLEETKANVKIEE